MAVQFDTPYITRTRQPEPSTDSGKVELFKPGSEQAERSMLDGMTRDMESLSIKDNIRALGALQNMNILSIRDGDSPDLDKVKAPIPGMDAERTLKGMIEDGLVKPSDSMRDVAERHGLEIPERNPEGPSPFRKENSPEMLSMPEPQGPLQNPGLREMTGKLVDQCQEPTKEKSEAFQALDKAFQSISSPMEKMLMSQGAPTNQEQDNALPWTKPASKDLKMSDLWTDPVGTFNEAAQKLGKLGEKAQKEVMDAVFSKPLEKIGKELQKDKEDITAFLKDPIGSIINTILKTGHGIMDTLDKKEKDRQALMGDMDKRGITAENLLKDPIKTCLNALEFMKEKAPLGMLSPGLMILEFGLKTIQKDKENIDKSMDDMQNFLADQPLFKGHIKKKGDKEGPKAPGQTPDLEEEQTASKKGPESKGPETPGTNLKDMADKAMEKGPTSAVTKTTDTVTTKSTPRAEGVKAAIEVVSAAFSDKKPMDKMADMGTAVGKGIVSVAQGVGTKVLAGAMATPIAPVAAAVALLALTAKFTTGKLLENMFPAGDTLPDPAKGAPSEKKEEPAKDGAAPKSDDKEGDMFEKAINFLMPQAGGKKGLMVKGGFKAVEKVGEGVKDELTGDKQQKAGEKQLQGTPDLSMQ